MVHLFWRSKQQDLKLRVWIAHLASSSSDNQKLWQLYSSLNDIPKSKLNLCRTTTEIFVPSIMTGEIAILKKEVKFAKITHTHTRPFWNSNHSKEYYYFWRSIRGTSLLDMVTGDATILEKFHWFHFNQSKPMTIILQMGILYLYR